jgi:hypothetical protein
MSCPAWNADELLKRRHDFRSQRADCIRDCSMEVSSIRHTIYAIGLLFAAPQRSGSGVTDSATRSRRMPLSV